jgi:hypothetical protein
MQAICVLVYSGGGDTATASLRTKVVALHPQVVLSNTHVLVLLRLRA